MSAFAVVAITDGNYNIHSEHGDSDGAVMEWHAYCRALLNDKSVKDATVVVVDNRLLQYDGKYERITHDQTAE